MSDRVVLGVMRLQTDLFEPNDLIYLRRCCRAMSVLIDEELYVKLTRFESCMFKYGGEFFLIIALYTTADASDVVFTEASQNRGYKQ